MNTDDGHTLGTGSFMNIARYFPETFAFFRWIAGSANPSGI
jgi:hypothetical protein